jgi:hypothetical protein
MHDPHVALEWLEATSFIKDSRRVMMAIKAFAKIFARKLGVHIVDIMADMQPISYETLRWARIKADMVAMSLHRRFWRGVADASDIFIWCDASPQWRGFELFASTIEIYDSEGNFHRRLAPVLSLQRASLDAMGKTAFLWQVWLMAGPRLADFTRFLSRVRGICTDMGIERLLANYFDTGKVFYEVMFSRVIPQELGTHTFPRALAIPGWRHLWDVVLRRGLASLSWFPGWMAGMRSLISFLRVETNMQQMTKDMLSSGFPMVAEIFAKMCLPTIADWRFGAFVSSCAPPSPVRLSWCSPNGEAHFVGHPITRFVVASFAMCLDSRSPGSNFGLSVFTWVMMYLECGPMEVVRWPPKI